MIRYKLACEAGHAFDCWFRSSSDFESQAASGLLSCPTCGGADIRKALMAPAVSSGAPAKTDREAPKEAPSHAAASGAEAPGPQLPRPASEPALALIDEKQARLRQLLREFRAELTKNSEDVGERFPEVARKMRDEEIEPRTIHGRATAEEAEALIDEGLPIHLLPDIPNDLN